MNSPKSDKTKPNETDSLVGVPKHKGAAAAGAVAGAAAAGAAVGAVAGPVGAVVGAAIGAAAGGLGADAIADSIDETHEATYWRDHYESRPYVVRGRTYADYAPAYSYAVVAYRRYGGKTFAEVEPLVATDWSTMNGPSGLSWEDARPAVLDAWERLDRNRTTAPQADRGRP